MQLHLHEYELPPTVKEIRPDVPEIIESDSTRVQQILINLLSNAVKFTDQGEISIRVAMRSEVAGQALLEFEVQDQGIGIPPEKIDILFEPFVQGDATTTRKYGGTGLGLAISKKLVELLGGKIAVRSEVGVGSTFSFCIGVKLGSERATPEKIGT